MYPSPYFARGRGRKGNGAGLARTRRYETKMARSFAGTVGAGNGSARNVKRDREDEVLIKIIMRGFCFIDGSFQCAAIAGCNES